MLTAKKEWVGNPIDCTVSVGWVVRNNEGGYAVNGSFESKRELMDSCPKLGIDVYIEDHPEPWNGTWPVKTSLGL